MIKAIAAAVAVAAVFAGSADATVPKPKPWQWPAAKMSTRLMAAAPFVWDEAKLQKVACVGQGKQVASRYSSFRCRISFGSINATPYTADLVARVLPVGTGKLCVVQGADGMAVRPGGGSAGVRVADGRGCA